MIIDMPVKVETDFIEERVAMDAVKLEDVIEEIIKEITKDIRARIDEHYLKNPLFPETIQNLRNRILMGQR